MRLYDVPAPAKLNLFLHVTGRRYDGYHLLQTAFRFVDLHDTLHFERRSDGVVACDDVLPGLAPQDNLILRAAKALQDATGVKWGAQISCEKRIPAGGGLGGGSSDAATTLIALNRLWDTRLDRNQLMKLALPLGADVPVFVFGRPAFAEGVGELLTPVALPERAYLIVHPAEHVATAQVFSSPDLTRDTKSIKMSVFADWLLEQRQAKQEVRPLQERAQLGLPVQPVMFGCNDLEAVVRARYPKVEQAMAFLTEHGIQARMSGSGACLFAEFVTHEQALLNQQKIIGKIPDCGDTVSVIDKTWVCHGYIDHPLRYWTKD